MENFTLDNEEFNLIKEKDIKIENNIILNGSNKVISMGLIIYTILTNNYNNLKVNIENEEINITKEIENFFITKDINEILKNLLQQATFNKKNVKIINGIYNNEDLMIFNNTKVIKECPAYNLIHLTLLKCFEILNI